MPGAENQASAAYEADVREIGGAVAPERGQFDRLLLRLLGVIAENVQNPTLRNCRNGIHLQTSKKRPALVISPPPYAHRNGDVQVIAFTSKPQPEQFLYVEHPAGRPCRDRPLRRAENQLDPLAPSGPARLVTAAPRL
jgi:hypothetical protein